MKIKSVYYIKSASNVSHFPNYSYPEFAFMGRSNVGKSSLINMIVGQKSLVKVGSKPGVTKSINFFMLNDRISLADLPGYGYAKLPQNLRKTFLPLIKSYVKERYNLRLAFLLIDIRREPLEFERDIIIHLTEKEIPIAIIATKCDKLSKMNTMKNAKKIASKLEIDTDSIYFSSSKTGESRKGILNLIEEFSRKDAKI
ncbi:MAG: ribosome biogenesis GTP-binding protein YihA/YsxC [Spirochaetota bacterium]|nr:ribosome biogenesis GTP-binding protein YihA/YsxC [Spirochaetota bacterium]